MSKLFRRNINDDDRDYLKLVGVPVEVINITTEVITYLKEGDVEYLTVDGMMYYYFSDRDDGNVLHVADSTKYYTNTKYLDVEVVERFKDNFGYVHNSEIDKLFLFHKKEKLRKLTNKL